MMSPPFKRIAVLGCTGSIGVNALKVIRANPDRYEATALGAGENIDLLLSQIREFKPRAVAVKNESLAAALTEQLGPPVPCDIFYGTAGYVNLVSRDDIDTVVSALAGAAGLSPTYAALRSGKQLALANKEAMVMAGPLIMAEARRQGVSVLPIDSEHSAILQSMQGHHREDVRQVILTASGGPFRNLSREEMKRVTPAQALNHPNWEMGSKITIDSATLMNKGLEAIEAKWLFDLDLDQITILIHPQSIVHSMVEYRDGSVIAQMGVPDMITPIAYALSFPRHTGNGLPSLKLEHIGTLTFERPDPDRFKCLQLALAAARAGDSMPAVLNTANEVAVEAFIEGKIGFLEIPQLIEAAMSSHSIRPMDDMEAVLLVDEWARSTTAALVDQKM